MNYLDDRVDDGIMPFNPTTGINYHGNNVGVLLGAASALGYYSNHWAGFDQWLGVGRVVKGGEHGTRIIRMNTKKLDDGTFKRFPGTATVFNLEQTKERA